MSTLRKLASGAKSQTAFKNIINYYSNYDKRPDKVGQRGGKPEQVKLYVHAFSQTFKSDIYWQGQGTQSGWNNQTYQNYLKDHVTGAVDTTSQTPDLVLKTGRSVLAKLIIKTGVLPTGKRRISDRTKLPYLDYEGTSVSIPFGRKDANDTEIGVFNLLVNKFKGQGTSLPAGTRLSRIKEKF